jgi:hypothetical protein
MIGLRKALKLPDDYEDIIGFPSPLADTLSEELDGKGPDGSSEQENE